MKQEAVKALNALGEEHISRWAYNITPGKEPKKTLFVNSGAEAVENGIKISRYETKQQAIIAFQNAFDGRTYMGMT